ncbi:hypothetical protein COHA_004844 [Chlorella ohadii]|uniref:Non-haem dioxygenase N-terminal domain-containing protein n=1 Tax=Chlorella ohadii TaxID=2649997 RepID=A0AAD5DS66_9CHLO|nr:hypothetical protein COHA_004844 [Chlorella ohadii]
MARPAAVEFSYKELADESADLSAKIEQAFGPGGLGICTVSGVPRFVEARQALLPLAAQLAALPEDAKAVLEDPASRYNFGWSCGREVLEGGLPDTRKGSFYANPLLDAPAGSDHTAAAHFPALARPNLWPGDQLPELEPALKALGAIVVSTGLLLARHCDKYCAAKGGHPPRLHDILAASRCHKGRLLHYFAPDASDAAADGANWCGWHFDNGSLTGLTSAMYLDAAGQPAACPDPGAGLHIKDRAGNVVQVQIPPTHLGFQVGEALQPHWDCPLEPPVGVSPADVGIGQWQPGLSFGETSERTMDEYYKAASAGVRARAAQARAGQAAAAPRKLRARAAARPLRAAFLGRPVTAVVRL